jgi:hypothetical protein
MSRRIWKRLRRARDGRGDMHRSPSYGAGMSSLTLSIPDALADKLRAAASARGETVEDYALGELTLAAEGAGDDIAEDLRRLAEPGESVPLDAAFDRFEAEILRLQGKSG